MRLASYIEAGTVDYSAITIVREKKNKNEKYIIIKEEYEEMRHTVESEILKREKKLYKMVPEYANILRNYYIKKKSLVRIAADMHYDYVTICRKLNKALLAYYYL